MPIIKAQTYIRRRACLQRYNLLCWYLNNSFKKNNVLSRKVRIYQNRNLDTMTKQVTNFTKVIMIITSDENNLIRRSLECMLLRELYELNVNIYKQKYTCSPKNMKIKVRVNKTNKRFKIFR